MSELTEADPPPPSVEAPTPAAMKHAPGTEEALNPVGPPFTPRPRAQQRWVHSCCSAAKLERALADTDISAIEADIMMGPPPTRSSSAGGVGNGGSSSSRSGDAAEEAARVPLMAHPTWRQQTPKGVDLTFADFIERCLADGTRHLKLDFKDLDAVEPCLRLLAERWPQLHSNGQAVWLNADVLPGPNARGPAACRVPAHIFLPLCRSLCPHAVLSLGWCVGPIGPEEAYTEHDVSEMRRLCEQYEIPGSAVVFASSLRLAERAVPLMGRLLAQVADAQLLLWTGTGELPVRPSMHTKGALRRARKALTAAWRLRCIVQSALPTAVRAAPAAC
jgi:hypothetical protein